MPRKPGRPRPPGKKAKRVRPPARPRFREEPAVIRARMAAAGESLKILSGPAPSTIELAQSINELTDRSIGQVHAACQDGHRVACRSGCTYCCMFPVAASVPEVLAIATFTRERFDDERQAALDARVEGNIAATDGMDMRRRDGVRLERFTLGLRTISRMGTSDDQAAMAAGARPHGSCPWCGRHAADQPSDSG